MATNLKTQPAHPTDPPIPQLISSIFRQPSRPSHEPDLAASADETLLQLLLYGSTSSRSKSVDSRTARAHGYPIPPAHMEQYPGAGESRSQSTANRAGYQHDDRVPDAGSQNPEELHVPHNMLPPSVSTRYRTSSRSSRLHAVQRDSTSSQTSHLNSLIEHELHFSSGLSSGAHPAAELLRARYWGYLLESLKRSVDDVYTACDVCSC